MRILVAEDTPANQRLVTTILKKRGHHVRVAQNGAEALEIFQREPFDLILMDVQMPVLDGFEATSAVRARESTVRDRVPIVAMTAHAMRGDRERCLSAGMDAYVSKPIDVPKLIELIESLTHYEQPSATS